MTDRERLIDLIIEAKRTDPETGSFTEYLADYLISNGVVVLPCNVGDTIYHLYPMIADRNGMFRADEINKTVFLTREEAEKALLERKSYEV